MSLSIKFHGHSTFSIVSDGIKILIDPFFGENPSAITNADDVEADFILISHGHFDHVADAVSIAQRTGAMVISNFEIASWFNSQGIENTHPLHIGGANQFPFGRCKLTIAHHGSVLPDGSYGGNPAGFLLKFNDGNTLYYSGDTALTYDMKWLADDDVDIALLCVGDNFTMGPEDAVKAVKLIEPKAVIPYHFDTWPYIECEVDLFYEGCETETSAKVIKLGVDETHTLG